MNLFQRRRNLLDNSLLPFIIWDNSMTSIEDIPINYTESNCTLTYIAPYLRINGTSGPAIKSVSFIIPAKYVKYAKACKITWYIQSAYSSCNVKITCDGQTIQDSGESNMQTRTFTPNISSLVGDMTITFTGNNVRIYNLSLEK